MHFMKNVNTRLKEDTIWKLEDMAAARGLKLGTFLRQIIQEWLEREETHGQAIR